MKDQHLGSPEYMKLPLEKRIAIARLLIEMEELRREAALIAWRDELQR